MKTETHENVFDKKQTKNIVKTEINVRQCSRLLPKGRILKPKFETNVCEFASVFCFVLLLFTLVHGRGESKNLESGITDGWPMAL